MKRATKKPITISFMTFEEVEKEYFGDITKIGDINGHSIRGIFEQYHEYHSDDLVFLLKEIMIDTLEGVMCMTKDHYLIIGAKGEIYPCRIDVFNETYNIIEEEK